MPSKSKKQHNLMALVANDPKAAKRLGIPQSVGQDYVEADKGRKFGSGGTMKESKAMMRKEVAFMKKKGAPKSMIKHEEAEYGMKRGGTAGSGQMAQAQMGQQAQGLGMKRGGMAADKAGRALGRRTPDTMGRAMVKKYAKGGEVGSYRRAADGIATKGKTKGKMVKMNMGGKC